jgi:RimJ/RimL family protein N-acetyltransferase
MGALEAVTLVGTSVRLEPLSRGHARALVGAAASGPRDSYAFTRVPATEADALAYIDEALALHGAGRALPFATVDATSGRVVGSTRFLNVEFWTWPAGSPLQRGAQLPDVVEIGATWLAPGAQRTAINTEAKLLMLTHAFEVWRVHRVSLMTDSRNVQSRNAILRLGAQFDGILRGARVAFDGGVRHTAAYSILEAEWPEVKAGLRAKLGV